MNNCSDKGKGAYLFDEIDILSLPDFISKIIPLFSAAAAGLRRVRGLLARMK